MKRKRFHHVACLRPHEAAGFELAARGVSVPKVRQQLEDRIRELAKKGRGVVVWLEVTSDTSDAFILEVLDREYALAQLDGVSGSLH